MPLRHPNVFLKITAKSFPVRKKVCVKYLFVMQEQYLKEKNATPQMVVENYEIRS